MIPSHAVYIETATPEDLMCILECVNQDGICQTKSLFLVHWKQPMCSNESLKRGCASASPFLIPGSHIVRGDAYDASPPKSLRTSHSADWSLRVAAGTTMVPCITDTTHD